MIVGEIEPEGLPERALGLAEQLLEVLAEPIVLRRDGIALARSRLELAPFRLGLFLELCLPILGVDELVLVLIARAASVAFRSSSSRCNFAPGDVLGSVPDGACVHP